MGQLEKEPVVAVSESSSFSSQLKPSKKILVIIALVFGVIGGAVLWHSFALTPTVASLEAEQMTVPSGASIISDSSASGGKAMKLTANGNAQGVVSLPSNATSVSLRAKGVRCHSAWPRASLQVDGKTLLSGINISSSSWNNYSANVALGSGTHAISIIFSNARGSCRPLYLDATTFYGPTAPTPLPTVSLTASPTSVTAGSASTLTWSSANASSCTASGSWTGSKLTSGSASTGALSIASTYNLSCTGSGGTTAASTTVVIASSAPSQKSIYWGAWMDGDTYGGGRGDAPWDSTTWDLFESHAGKKVSIVHYGQPPMWEQAFQPGTASLVTNRGAIPLMDMGSSSVSLTSITNGTYDASITAWADAAKAWGKPFLFRWNWEMNGPWFSWGAQAQQNPGNYVAAWKHIHDVVASRGANNVTWVWCPNTVYSGSTPLNQLYPGDSYVDWTCIDGYNSAMSGGSSNSWQSFSQIFQPTYNQILSIAPSKPIMIGETASNEGGGSKAAWITDTLQSQLPNSFPNIKAFVWFNWPIYENGVTQQWPIESSPAAQAAFAQGIASPYYSSNNYSNLSPLTKVQPPQ